MDTIISLLNVKGGVGKTTSTLNIAGQFAKFGHKVLLIDNDSQSNLSQILNVESQYNLYDLYSNSKVKVEDCIVKYNDFISIIPNTIESSTLESELHNKMTRETILKNKFSNYNNDFDLILIDNSPFLGICTTNALAMSNYYIEVIDNSTSALQGLNLVANLVNDIKENGINNNIKSLGVLRSNFDRTTLFSKQISEVVSEQYKDKLFTSIIYNSIKYKEAVADNKTIQEYNEKYAEPYENLYYEILSKLK